MYKLKEELFDSQNEVKTIQQEFNTYKIFNQIEKINMEEKWLGEELGWEKVMILILNVKIFYVFSISL